MRLTKKYILSNDTGLKIKNRLLQVNLNITLGKGAEHWTKDCTTE